MSSEQLSLFGAPSSPDVDAAAPTGPVPARSDLNEDTVGQAAPERPVGAVLAEATTAEMYAPPSGAISRVKANLAALEVLRVLPADLAGIELSGEQQRALAGWSSWGAVSGVFDTADAKLGRFCDDVADALGNEPAWLAARRTILNAHYTAPEVARFMWSLPARTGLDAGEALEPGCGAGMFIAAAPDRWSVTGVEADPTSARIAQLLHPDAAIVPSRLENWSPQSDFDLAVGNVPFSDVEPYCARLNVRRKLALHNYCLAVGLEALRPGGLLVCLTSMWTMDSRRSVSRETLSRYGKFVAAIRLPNTAFTKFAGTGAVTDMVVMQRRPTVLDSVADGELSEAELAWLNTAELDGWQVNGYYAAHPEMMLGTLDASDMYGGESHTLRAHPDAGELADQLEQAATSDMVSEAFEHARAASQGTRRRRRVTIDATAEGRTGHRPSADDAAGRAREGTIISEGMRFYQLRDGVWAPFERPPKSGDPQGSAAELRAFLDVRDAALTVFNFEGDHGADERDVDAARSRLGDAYAAHQRGGWGLISRQPRRANGTRVPWQASGFASDPHYHLVRGLEDPKLVAAGADDVRSAIFCRRVLTRTETHGGTAETVTDAVMMSMARTGAVWLDEVSAALGREVTVKGLAPAAFLDPDTGELAPAARYLAGNVRRRLDAARKAAAAGHDMDANISALEAVQPERVRSHEIEVELGVPWVTPVEVAEFARETLACPRLGVVRPENTWAVEVPRWGEPIPSLRTKRWGHERLPAERLLERILNQRSMTIYHRRERGEPLRVDTKATMRALEISQQWQQAFAQWCFDGDPERAGRLEDRYNEYFAGWVVPTYPAWPRPIGMSDDWDLRSHQARSVTRILCEGSVVLGHEVGSGKTATMCAAAMEAKRLGIARKPMHVIPLQLTDQFAAAFQSLFPNASLLVFSNAASGNARAAREEFAAACATRDWDSVIVSDTAFAAMPVSDQFAASEAAAYLAKLHRRRDEWLANDDENDDDRKAVRQIEADIKRATQQLGSTVRAVVGDDTDVTAYQASDWESVADEAGKAAERMRYSAEERFKEHDASHTGTIAFDDLGVDLLFVDEAHNYKNLALDSSSSLFAGKRGGSRRATDLDRKLAWLRSRHDGQPRVVLATGTPVSNQLHELYVMQRYVQPQLLEQLGIAHIDAWLAMFADKVSAPEVSVTGEWRMKERVATYRCLPELMRVAGQNIELLSYEQLGLPRPSLSGGDPIVVEVPATKELCSFIDYLAEREAMVRAKEVTPEIDNMLWICNDARAAALHLGLVGIDQPYPGKLDYAAERIVEVWDRHRADVFEMSPGVPHPRKGALQLVFMDIGTPGGSAKVDLYAELRDKLVAEGMDAERIRFFSERGNSATQRDAFDEECRTGGVDVLIASTARAGVGLNIQDRMVALHHLDAPWRPSDVTQRVGRMLRQGNNYDEVSELRYASVGTFDSFTWQTLERKQGFIEQLCSLRPGQRRITDLDADVRKSFRNVKAIASGDPRMLREIELQDRLQELQVSQSAHRVGVARSSREIRQRHDDLERVTEWVDLLDGFADADPVDGQDPVICDAAHRVLEPGEDSDRLLGEAISTAVRRRDGTAVATVNGATVHATRDQLGYARLRLGSSSSPLHAGLSRDDLDSGRLGLRIRNLVGRRRGLAARMSSDHGRLVAEIAVLEAEVAAVWPHDAELNAAVSELEELRAAIHGRDDADDAGIEDVADDRDAIDRADAGPDRSDPSDPISL